MSFKDKYDNNDEETYYEEEVDFGEDVPMFEVTPEPVKQETPPQDKKEEDEETDPFAVVSNNQDTAFGLDLINIANVRRPVIEDEEETPIVDTLSTKTDPVESELTQQNEQQGIQTEPAGGISSIFDTGLEIIHPVQEEKSFEDEMDALYEKPQEEQKAEVTTQGSQPPEGVVVPEVDENDIESEYFIFGSMLGDKEEKARFRKELLLEFNKNNIFEDEFYVLYRILHDYTKVYPNKQFIRTYLQTHQAIYQNLPNVNVNKFRLGDNDPYAEFVASCIYTLEKCEKINVTEEDFYLHLEIKKMTYINNEAIRTFAEGTQILVEGLGQGKYTKKGYVDMRMHVNKEFTKLDNLMHKTNRKGMIVYGKTNLDDDDNHSRLLFKFGIKALDEALGGINEGMMVSLLAPPKGFKTRLSTFILHNAIISGVNSLVWSLENGYKGVECLIRARHFYWYYQENGMNNDGKLDINAKDIMDGTLPPEIAELEYASWTDLQTNENYGTLINMDEPFELDTFVDRLEEAIKLHNVQFIELDYLQLVDGGGDGMTKSERVGSSYQRTLRLLKNNNVAGLMPGQIKQSVINDLSRLDEQQLGEYELRDAGGESSEVIRTPDLNIMIYGTKTMIDEGKSYLISVPSRYSKPFKPIKLAVKAQHCTFASVPDDAW